MPAFEGVPFCVDPDWVRSEIIANTGGPAFRLLYWSETLIGFEHRCDRGERGTIICAPLLKRDGHQVSGEPGSITVSPSILCGDCGTHGFITASRWAGC